MPRRTVIFFVALLFICAACKQSGSPSARPIVLVSIAPYQLFVERIGGEYFDVRSIVPPGADAHTFEPTPQQQAALQSAKIWFRIGEPFEQMVLHQAERWHVADLRDGIEMLQTADGEDRHIWLSPKTVQTELPQIVQVLSQEFPEHRATFETNAEILRQELERLDQEMTQKLANAEDSTLLVSHAAFGYLCRDYHLKQVAVEIEGREVRTKQFHRFLIDLQKNRPRAAIALPQHNNKGVQMIARALNIPLQTIDPYSHDYFEMMRALVKWIESH